MDDLKQKAAEKAFDMRVTWKANDDKRDSGLSTPETIKRDDNIKYDKKDKLQILDVYRPKSLINNDKKLPVIVNIHGGAWVYSTKETYQFYCMSLSEQGFAVVNFSYRLAPEYKHPAQIEDINTVFKWIYENKENFNFDIKNVFCVGDSVGAQLTALYCCMLVNEDLASTIKFSLQKNIIPNAVALNCGTYRLYQSAEESLVGILLYALLDNVNDETKSLVSPDLFINNKFPSTFIMSCYGDPSTTEYYYMKKIIEKKIAKVVGKYYGTVEEKLFHIFHCDIRNETAKICNKEECDFFKENIIE